MTIPCAVSAAERAYQASLDRGDRRADAVERERERLMQPGEAFYPWSAANFADALADLDGVAIERARAAFADCHVAGAGGVLYYAVHNYWQRRAIAEAENIVAGRCPACYGLGCQACDADH